MERLHMNHLRDLIHRLQAGDSERRIARDMRLARPTVHKYHQLALQQGYLEPGASLPDEATLQKVLGNSCQVWSRMAKWSKNCGRKGSK